jgi:hypothetical protein
MMTAHASGSARSARRSRPCARPRWKRPWARPGCGAGSRSSATWLAQPILLPPWPCWTRWGAARTSRRPRGPVRSSPATRMRRHTGKPYHPVRRRGRPRAQPGAAGRRAPRGRRRGRGLPGSGSHHRAGLAGAASATCPVAELAERGHLLPPNTPVRSAATCQPRVRDRDRGPRPGHEREPGPRSTSGQPAAVRPVRRRPAGPIGCASWPAQREDLAALVAVRGTTAIVLLRSAS